MNTETWAWNAVQISEIKKGDVYHYPTPHPDIRDVCIATQDAQLREGEPSVEAIDLGYAFVRSAPLMRVTVKQVEELKQMTEQHPATFQNGVMTVNEVLEAA